MIPQRFKVGEQIYYFDNAGLKAAIVTTVNLKKDRQILYGLHHLDEHNFSGNWGEGVQRGQENVFFSREEAVDKIQHGDY